MESVSSGPMTRKFRCSLFSFITSRRKCPSTRVADAAHCPGLGNVNRVVAKIRHLQVFEQKPAVGVGICSHASFSLGRKFGQFRFQASLLIEEFFGLVASQPVFQQLEVFGIARQVGQRNLMRAKRAFNRQTIDNLRPRPALG